MALQTLPQKTTLQEIENRYWHLSCNLTFWQTKLFPLEQEALSQFTVVMHNQFGDMTWNDLDKSKVASPLIVQAYEHFEKTFYDRLKIEGKFDASHR